ncbi:hypothetical protein [Gilvimarinus polysaccharolyticus]|uniref:hypothetical protein n=1 Tax=Gilvimarinus polysaccharolyticus TaxID=863921 RepID=UPI0006732E14|nr:hypothetical protein [Gilvimarinus polysaccharolyticus]
MFGFGATIKKITSYNAAAKAPAPLPLSLVMVGLLCAFGLWSAPALLLTYMGLINDALSTKTLFVAMALTGLYAMSLRLLLGCLPALRAEPGLLLALLLVLFGLSVLLFFLADFAAGAALPWLALLAGVGGGCHMVHSGAAITSARVSAYSLEATTAVGHLGIIVGLLVLPLLVTVSFPGQSGQVLLFNASHFLGKVRADTSIWLSWVGVFWGLACAVTLLFWMLRPSWYRAGSWRQAVNVLGVFAVGLVVSVVGAVFLLHAVKQNWSLWLWLVPVLLVLVLSVAILRLFLPAARWQPLVALWSHRHLWVMSASWVASLGSFLGFTLVFPLLTAVLFRSPTPLLNNSADSRVFLYAWMLPLAALLMRPLGRWAAQRWGGVWVAQVCFILLGLAAVVTARYIDLALGSVYSSRYFTGYLVSFGMMFTAAGLAHAALVQAQPAIFPPCLRLGANVWLMAMATVGMAYIPLMLAYYSEANMASAFIGFAVFYAICALLNGLFYLRRRSFIYQP